MTTQTNPPPRLSQELELQVRCLDALDALPAAAAAAPLAPPAPAAPLALASAAATGALEAGGGGDSSGSGGAFDARLRRLVAQRLGRAEAAQAWEARVASLQQELSAECARRLEAAEAEWAARCEARVAGERGERERERQGTTGLLLLW